MNFHQAKEEVYRESAERFAQEKLILIEECSFMRDQIINSLVALIQNLENYPNLEHEEIGQNVLLTNALRGKKSTREYLKNLLLEHKDVRFAYEQVESDS